MLGSAVAMSTSSSSDEESSPSSSLGLRLLFTPLGGARFVMRLLGATCVLGSSGLFGRVRSRNLNGDVEEGASAWAIGGDGSCVGAGGGVSIDWRARQVE